MMYADLFEYFLKYKDLTVPGIGTFLLRERPATIDFPAKTIYGPTYNIQYQYSQDQPATRMIKWLAGIWKLSIEEASQKFNSFSAELTTRLKEGYLINWKGIGVISRNDAGEIEFKPDVPVKRKPVAANRVLREKAEHSVRVGEAHRTSEEMHEMLATHPATPKSLWWVWGIVLGILSVVFIGWYFSEHGVAATSTSNNGKAPADSSPVSTYKMVQ